MIIVIIAIQISVMLLLMCAMVYLLIKNKSEETIVNSDSGDANAQGDANFVQEQPVAQDVVNTTSAAADLPTNSVHSPSIGNYVKMENKAPVDDTIFDTTTSRFANVSDASVCLKTCDSIGKQCVGAVHDTPNGICKMMIATSGTQNDALYIRNKQNFKEYKGVTFLEPNNNVSTILDGITTLEQCKISCLGMNIQQCDGFLFNQSYNPTSKELLKNTTCRIFPMPYSDNTNTYLKN